LFLGPGGTGKSHLAKGHRTSCHSPGLPRNVPRNPRATG
jgi:hypothetical protein